MLRTLRLGGKDSGCRLDADGEWKFVQKRKGKSCRSPENSVTTLDKSTAQARESHRTFVEVVSNGPVDQKPSEK